PGEISVCIVELVGLVVAAAAEVVTQAAGEALRDPVVPVHVHALAEDILPVDKSEEVRIAVPCAREVIAAVDVVLVSELLGQIRAERVAVRVAGKRNLKVEAGNLALIGPGIQLQQVRRYWADAGGRDVLVERIRGVGDQRERRARRQIAARLQRRLERRGGLIDHLARNRRQCGEVIVAVRLQPGRHQDRGDIYAGVARTAIADEEVRRAIKRNQMRNLQRTAERELRRVVSKVWLGLRTQQRIAVRIQRRAGDP